MYSTHRIQTSQASKKEKFPPGAQTKHYGSEWKANEVQIKPASDGLTVANAFCGTNPSATVISLCQARKQPEIGKCPRFNGSLELTRNYAPSNIPVGDHQKVKAPVFIRPHAGAGLQIQRRDDLDLQKHIVPHLSALEDNSLSLKITEDKIGGFASRIGHFELGHVYGLPTLTDPTYRIGKVTRLTSNRSYSDDIGARGLISPTPNNTYGSEKLLAFKRSINI